MKYVIRILLVECFRRTSLRTRNPIVLGSYHFVQKLSFAALIQKLSLRLQVTATLWLRSYHSLCSFGSYHKLRLFGSFFVITVYRYNVITNHFLNFLNATDSSSDFLEILEFLDTSDFSSFLDSSIKQKKSEALGWGASLK